MSTLNSRHIGFLLPNFSVRKVLYPEASASLNNEVRTFNTKANASNPISFRSGTTCVKTDEILVFFSTPSNSPYLRGESISFCRRQFPSPSIVGRVRDGGRGELGNFVFTQTVHLGTSRK